MARLAIAAAFGIVVGMVAGAAAGIHAFSSSEPPVADTAAEDTPPVAVEPAYGLWDRVAQCEANGNWQSASNRIYKGGLQFDAPTWARYGGLAYAWRADFATRAQQIAVAERTLSVQGWQAWPRCSRILGLR